MTVEVKHVETLAQLHRELAGWECDQLVEIVAFDRNEARHAAHLDAVEGATAIILVGNDPLRWAATLGGTALAQSVRRANARSKLVAGVGAVSAFMCQHLISPGPQPTTLRGAILFGPGLGLVNRLVVDATNTTAEQEGIDTQAARRRLLAAVAANPFLIGMALPSGGAAILYPDNTLQASGPNPVVVVDGQEIEAADLDVAHMEGVVGARHYTLHTGEGFNLDDHTVRPKGEIDLPSVGPVTSVF
jgi:cyanophycinase